MQNFRDLFLDTLIAEIAGTASQAPRLKTSVSRAQKPVAIANPLNLVLPQSIIDLYAQAADIAVLWEIDETEENIRIFEENKFLKDRYFSQDYSWGVVKDLLTGFINISHAKQIFNPKFNQTQAHTYAMGNKLKDIQNYFAFDVQSGITACLKSENGLVADNVWLIHTDAFQLYDMKIGVADYLNLAYQSKCIHHWQLAYLFKTKAETTAIMNQILPVLFPHLGLDLTKFNQK